MPKFTINREDFVGHEFQSIMVSGDGRRLWACVKDGGLSYKVENLRDNGEIVIHTQSFGEAVRVFNET